MKRFLVFWSLFIFIFLLGLSSCKNHNEATPKPRSFPKVNFPERNYVDFSSETCAFTFEKPGYSKVEKDSFFMEDLIAHPCWFDLVFPDFNGKLHCSYYELDNSKQLDSLIYDSFALVGKHNIKADYIEEIPILLNGKGGGMMFLLSGPVASPTQFFLTDSTNHFFRASLYFYNKVHLDSMTVIHDFVNEDIEHLLETFEWK